MNKLIWALPVFFVFGCISVTPNPGSERVRVLDAEPKGCIYVGEVSSLQKDRDLGTLETEMSLDTRIDLRNKAHKLGGNILVFLKGKGTDTLPGGVQKGEAAPAQVSAATSAPALSDEEAQPEKGPLVFLATVFKCPSSILNQ